MLQLFLPYMIFCPAPLEASATFCTGPSARPIAFTSEEKVVNFVEQARQRLGLKLDWGMASELEFPGLELHKLDLDPVLPSLVVRELARI